MHVVRLEAGAVERRGHLALAVDALLAQHGDLRPAGARSRAPLGRQRKRQLGAEAGILRVEHRIERLARALRIVAQRLHPVGELRPLAPELDARRAIQLRAGAAHDDVVVLRDARDRVVRQPLRGEQRRDALLLGGRHLDHDAELLVEEIRDRVGGAGLELDVETDVAGERHLDERREQAAVRAVVIREQQTARAQLALRREPARQALRIVDVGRRAAELAERLRETRAAEPLRAAGEIDEQQHRLRLALQLRRQRAANVGDGRERRDDQRHRRRDGAFSAVRRATPCA